MERCAQFALSLLVIILGLFLEHAYASEPSRKNMSNIENRVSRLFESTKTVCVGRYLIDVPADSETIYGPAWVLADIERYQGQAAQLQSALADSLAEVEKNRFLATDDLAGPNSMLGKVVEDGKDRILFSIGSGSVYKLEAYVPLKDDLYVLSLTSWEKGKQLDDLHELTEIAHKFIARTDDSISDLPGVCVDGALIGDSEKPRPERVTFGLRLRPFDDVHFSISMTTKDQIVESDGLEQRVESAKRQAKSRAENAWFASIKFLRKGNRSLGGWNGYEILARKPPQKHELEYHEFAFTSHGEPNNPIRPVLELEMHTGVVGNRRGATKPSITDEEAIQLWDKVFGSIRPRPVQSANLEQSRQP